MKVIVIIFFLVLSSFCLAQKTLIDEFGVGTNFCSNTFYLYSDSTFYFERGCEGRSNLTFGNFHYQGDSLILLPLDSNEIVLLSNFDFQSDSSKFISITAYTLDDSIYYPWGRFTSLEKAQEWKDHLRQFDSLDESQYVTIDFEKGYSKLNNNHRMAFCLYELEGIIGREYVILEPGINKITINISLPDKITKLLTHYNMKYANMDAGTIQLSDRKIYVVKQ